MSRRERRPPAGRDAPAPRRPAPAPRRDTASRRRDTPAPRRAAAAFPSGLLAQILFLLGVFAVVTAVAELAGAANLGVAIGIGQIGFAIALVFLLLRR